MELAENRKDEITGYLLGALSAEARAALETRYFDDDDFFVQVEECERELIDDYACGRLSAQQRQQFEQVYLAQPDRRARLRFGEALAARLAVHTTAAPTWRERLRAALLPFQSPLVFASGLAALLLALGSLWLWQETARLRHELQVARLAQTDEAQRARALQEQLAAQQQQSHELSTELEELRTQQSANAAPSLANTFATLVLSVTGSRATASERPPELNLTTDIKAVRLKLKLKKNEYRSYQAVLEHVGGSVIWTQKNLKPKAAFIEITVPSDKFLTGDYILTLSGLNPNSEPDDLAKPYFRVRKR